MNLRAGILIIGSLYWEPSREEWRNSRLSIKDEVSVLAPIRYGRFSKHGRKHYTMVFSTSTLPGTAKVIPCKKPLQGIDDLIEEAQYLWAAERLEPKSNEISTSWGSVAVLFQDNNHALLDEWKQSVLLRTDYHSAFTSAEGEDQIVSKSGELCLPWTVDADNKDLAGFDVLFATANEPTLDGKAYPNPKVIAEHFNNRGWTYFDKNVQNAITTFEDAEIRRYRDA